MVYSLCLSPWSSWLGMVIEPETLARYAPAQVIAHCVSEMTLHGFIEAESQEFLAELRRRVDEIEAMTPEEREIKLIPAEKVFADLKAKFEPDDKDL